LKRWLKIKYRYCYFCGEKADYVIELTLRVKGEAIVEAEIPVCEKHLFGKNMLITRRESIRKGLENMAKDFLTFLKATYSEKMI